MPVERKPLDLGGGRTVANPCNTFGLGVCSALDVRHNHTVLYNQQQALVVALNEFDKLLAANKAAWEATGKPWKGEVPGTDKIVFWDYRTNAAWSLEGQALAMLKADDPSRWGAWISVDDAGAVAARLAQMAAKVHAATYDVQDAILELGAKVPEPPIPAVEPPSMADALVNLAKKGVEATAWTIGGIALAVLGWGYINSRGKGRRR